MSAIVQIKEIQTKEELLDILNGKLRNLLDNCNNNEQNLDLIDDAYNGLLGFQMRYRGLNISVADVMKHLESLLKDKQYLLNLSIRCGYCWCDAYLFARLFATDNKKLMFVLWLIYICLPGFVFIINMNNSLIHISCVFMCMLLFSFICILFAYFAEMFYHVFMIRRKCKDFGYVLIQDRGPYQWKSVISACLNRWYLIVVVSSIILVAHYWYQKLNSEIESI